MGYPLAALVTPAISDGKRESDSTSPDGIFPLPFLPQDSCLSHTVTGRRLCVLIDRQFARMSRPAKSATACSEDSNPDQRSHPETASRDAPVPLAPVSIAPLP